MRPPSVYANRTCPAGCACDVLGLLHGPQRVGLRLVMILLSQQHWTPTAIAELLGCDPATVRRWIHRYNQQGVVGLADRPRSGRPRLGSPRLPERIRRLLAQPKAWTIRRLWQALGRPAMSRRTLHRRVREVARWRRPRLVAKGDPDRDQILASLRQRLAELPEAAVVLVEDETHINLLPWVRATWIPTGTRQHVMTPGTNRRRTIFGAVELATGRFLDQVTPSPSAPPSSPSASSCLTPTRPRPWSRSSATTSSSTARSWSSAGWLLSPGCWCCTGPATARTTTRSSASGACSRHGWPTARP
jgi:transposase